MADALARFQARWQLGFIPLEQAPAAAAQLLESGLAGNALTTLAGLNSPSRPEVEPLVKNALAECGAAPMTDTDARWLLVRAGVEAITAGMLPPREGVDQLAFLCQALESPEGLREFVDLAARYDSTDPRCDDRIRAVAVRVLAALRQTPGAAT